MATGDNDYGFAKARRLRTPAEFSAVLNAPRERSIRAARQCLSVIAAWTEAGITERTAAESAAARVRFGVTVGKRNARRAVDRALVKRIVREACRHRASAFERCAAQAAVCIDIALRLKSPLTDADGRALAMAQWRRQLRAEADALLEYLLAALAGRLPLLQVNDDR